MLPNNRRRLACCTLSLGLTANMALPSVLHAQSQYPDKPITLVVPFAAGGNLDVMARLVGASMSRTLGQPIVVSNRGGAGGLIGHESVARAQPDGHTIVVTANGSFAVTPKLAAKPSFNTSDFLPIGAIAATPLVIAVPASSRFANIADLIAYAKANPQGVSIGHAGNGTTNHVAILQLEAAADLAFNVIPYKGSAPAVTDVLGGQIDAIIDQLPSSLPHIQAQRLRALAVTTPDRAKDLPQTPTLGEQTGLQGFDVSTTTGLLAPAHTPRTIIHALNAALNQALTEDAIVARIKALGSEPRPTTPAQFQAFLNQEDAKALELLKSGKLKAQ